MDIDEALCARLGANVKQLRESRGLTQARISKLAGIPRATFANLESGEGNPTLAVLNRVATALQVSLEELVATPRAACRYYERESLPVKKRGDVTVRRLLPDPIPAMEIDRMELPRGATLTGVPHTPGTREYLMCEAGTIRLVAAGESWDLRAGDLVVFRGDQRHSYANVGKETAVGYSVVMLARG